MAIDVEPSLAAIVEADHSQTHELRIFGPPGTGKTTTLAKRIREAGTRYGYAGVMVSSFSRAAAAELAGHDFSSVSPRIGTLHSFCWHALGQPRIVEAHVEDWNRQNPGLRITPVQRESRLEGEDNHEDRSEDIQAGNLLLSQLNQCRGKLVPEEAWPIAVREFQASWSEYKRNNCLLDFTDLIDIAAKNIRIAPGSPSAIFVDEAQDLNPMQLALLRRWGSHADQFVLAADDDQTIYHWCGATPEALLSLPVPEDHKAFLQQSHRVPRKVHAFADRLIQRVAYREPKVYRPRDEDGHVIHLSHGRYKAPEYGILRALTRHLEGGQTVMLLASCSYMLQPLIAVLRKSGIPFHNPYRKSAGFWNPLRQGSNSACTRISSLLKMQSWTVGDVRCFSEWLCPAVFTTEGQSILQSSDPSSQVHFEWLAAVFSPFALKAIRSCANPAELMCWWRKQLLPAFQKRVEYPTRVAQSRGVAALDDPPKIIVGTIHSVKGGEADVVFLFPDLSAAGDSAYQTRGPSRDAVLRLFYVGITRARHTLYICQGESARAIVL